MERCVRRGRPSPRPFAGPELKIFPSESTAYKDIHRMKLNKCSECSLDLRPGTIDGSGLTSASTLGSRPRPMSPFAFWLSGSDKCRNQFGDFLAAGAVGEIDGGQA
jgi:hypothetical protein